MFRIYQREQLDALFLPKTIAVVGATERGGSFGALLVHNLTQRAFAGTIYLVNPNRQTVAGLPTYPTITDVPASVDLALIVVPAPSVPDIIGQCVVAGVGVAVVLSAGFREIGAAGMALEQEILERAKHQSGHGAGWHETEKDQIASANIGLGARRPLRVVGPNSLGLMRPSLGLNATFVASMARPGKVAFISQSGALGAAILDWSKRENIGFSVFVSVGSMVDISWGDLITWLGDDPLTQTIILYMEAIGDARSFLSAAREVALRKPIIAIKGGRSAAAALAAASHTGSLAGRDEVIEAAFRRCGVLRVDSIAELFYMADVLDKQPRPKGPRLSILSNAGGPGVLATDALITAGGKLAELAPITVDALDKLLPANWSHRNPVDLLGDAGPERYAAALEIVSKDPNTDGVLVIVTPHGITDPTRTAERLRGFARLDGMPLLASWMGGPEVEAGAAVLNQANIPVFDYPDTAARMFDHMWRYTDNLRGIYETPILPAALETDPRGRADAQAIINAARCADRTLLDEFASKRILTAYGLPVVETRAAVNEAEAVALGERLGYPVVLKLLSTTLAHKSAVGGVRLNLHSAEAVREAYRAIALAACAHGDAHFLGVTVQPMIERTGCELIIGSSLDTQFGPVLLFGAGGQWAEAFGDRALGLPPLNTTLARRMMERTRIYRLLCGRSFDMASLEQLLVRLSELVVEQPWIREIDINPLFATPKGFIALDARMVLHSPALTEPHLPRLAIRPFPTQYVGTWSLPDGTPLTIRPIRPEDEPLMQDFHKRLSEETVYMRYFHMVQLSQRIAHEPLTRLCFIDFDREMALVVERKDAGSTRHAILAVGRLSRTPRSAEAEFDLLVDDAYQRQGLGTELLRRLIEIGQAEGLRRITAAMLRHNHGMQRACQKLGFQLKYMPDDQATVARLDL